MTMPPPYADTQVVGDRAERVTPRWPVWLLLCLLSALFAAFATGAVSFSAYLATQVWLAVTLTLVWLLCAGVHDRTTWTDRLINAAHLLFWSAFGGPFGTAIAAALLVPSQAVGATIASYNRDDCPASMLSRVERLHHAMLDRRLRLGYAHAIDPMLDVIINGTQQEKFDALRLIGRRYAPPAALALKRAIEDKDAPVRVLAATVLAQQNNTYISRIGAHQAATKAAPDRADDWMRLGQAHLDYAESGLLEESRADDEHGRAIRCFARAEQLGHRPVGPIDHSRQLATHDV